MHPCGPLHFMQLSKRKLEEAELYLRQAMQQGNR